MKQTCVLDRYRVSAFKVTAHRVQAVGPRLALVIETLVQAGNLEDHARHELERAGLFSKDSDYGGMLGKAVLALICTFRKQGHSGFSAMMTLDLFNRLGQFKVLTPITSDSEEWNDVSDMGGRDSPPLWQNKRCPSTFSNDAGKTWWDVDENDAEARVKGSEEVDAPVRFITLDELKKAAERYDPVPDPGFDGFIGVFDPDKEEKRRRTRERQEKMKRRNEKVQAFKTEAYERIHAGSPGPNDIVDQAARSGEAVEFSAHGKKFSVEKQGPGAFVLRCEGLGGRSLQGNRPQIMDGIAYVLRHGVVPGTRGPGFRSLKPEAALDVTNNVKRLLPSVKYTKPPHDWSKKEALAIVDQLVKFAKKKLPPIRKLQTELRKQESVNYKAWDQAKKDITKVENEGEDFHTLEHVSMAVVDKISFPHGLPK